MTAEGASAPARPSEVEALGLTHVASCSFLASRLAPAGQFPLALGGGVALARVGQRLGLRVGYGASIAAMVQTVALIGPARFNAPLTQALNAPVVGRLQARGASIPTRIAACLGIRLVHYAILNVIFVALVFGGLDEYVKTYDKVTGGINDALSWLASLPIHGHTRIDAFPNGQTAALLLTIVGAMFYAAIFSVIQVLVCDRALSRWPDGEQPVLAARGPRPQARRVFGAPILVALGWIAMLAFLSWPTLGVVAGVLVVATVATSARKAGRTTWMVGVALAGVLVVSAMFPAIVGAVHFGPAAQRALRAALMALTATWARAYAGSDGLREFARRILWGESARLIEQLESDGRLRPAADDMIKRLGGVEIAPAPLADALTEWVATEARAYRPPA